MAAIRCIGEVVVSTTGLQELAPGLEVSRSEAAAEPYIRTVQRLAKGQERILVVCHREGIRDVVNVVGCCAASARTAWCWLGGVGFS